jgi:AcrR family transcriptional regulator
MPRSPKDNQQIRDARREELLAAAGRVFAEKGFARTKISEIAAAAGLSHGLVYHYFENKDAIFGAIVDTMLARIDQDLEVEGERAIDRIEASIERARTRCCQTIDAGKVVSQTMMQGQVPDAIRTRVAAHVRGAHAKAVEWIAEAQEDGDVDRSVPAEELASAMFCLVRGMSIRMPGMPDLPFVLPRTQTVLRMLRPIEAAARVKKREAPTPSPAGSRSRRDPNETAERRSRKHVERARRH